MIDTRTPDNFEWRFVLVAMGILAVGVISIYSVALVSTGQEIVEQVAALAVKVRDSRLMPDVAGIGVDSWGMGALVD